MNTTVLIERVEALEQELAAARTELARAASDPAATTAELAASRAYAFDAAALDQRAVLDGCAAALQRYGFCVIDHVIPGDRVAAVRDEVVSAAAKVASNIAAIKRLAPGADPATVTGAELRHVRRRGLPPKPPNDIIWMPQYAQHLANPAVVALARQALDDHLRIAQLHTRIIPADQDDGTPGGFGPAREHGSDDIRGWHTDWPHDLSAYGRDDPRLNAGCIRQPFPDLTMCLVMIWYLSDVDPSSGATWVVPGSHRDPRNPRGPADDMNPSAPIPGEMQVTAPAGSVFIQDSRTWHSSPRHNSRHDRVAVVTRWCPWWLAVDDYAPGQDYCLNMICRPLAHDEYLALPSSLQPLMRHLCPDEHDTLQPPVLQRAGAAGGRTQRGIEMAEADPDALRLANATVCVPLAR